MSGGKSSGPDRKALKRKYQRFFGARAAHLAGLQEVVRDLVRQRVSRATLVRWAMQQGISKRAASTLLSRIFCALGLRERQTGAGRKPLPEGLELLALALARYGEKCPRVLRGALWAWKKQLAAKAVPPGKTPLLQLL